MTNDSALDVRPGIAGALEALLPPLEGPQGSHGKFEVERAPGGVTRVHGWVYAEHVDRLVNLLVDGNVTFPFDWTTWIETPEAQTLLESPERVSAADLTDVRRLLTVLVRRERFSGGSLMAAIERGLVPALVRRLLVLLREREGTNA